MFGSSKNIFLGIDIGTSSMKMAEVTVETGKPILTNYAWMPLVHLSGHSDMDAQYYDGVLLAYMRKMLAVSKIKASNTYVSVPAFGGLIVLIDFPQMDKKDLEQAVRFEAHKYIPTSLDEVVLSWEVIGKSSLSGGSLPGNSNGQPFFMNTNEGKETLHVILVAVSKDRVMRYQELITKAGLKFKSAQIESFAMVNSLIGNDPGTFLIVDIGSLVCNLIIVKGGIIQMTRNIAAGGIEITRTIARSMGIDENRAESLKISNRNFFGSDSEIKFTSLEMICQEINRLVGAYINKGSSNQIDAIVLSGGTANFTGLCEYFEKNLKIKTIVGDPLSRMAYDRRLEPKLNDIRTQFSVCIGLALKGVTEYLSGK